MFTLDFFNSLNNSADGFLRRYNHSHQPIILFGVGASISLYIGFLTKHGLRPDFIVDNDPSKNGTFYDGYKICNVEELKKYTGAYIIISAPSHYAAITKQLNSISTDYNIITFDPSLDIIQNCNHQDRRAFFSKHINELNSLYDILSDDQSRLTLNKIIEGSITNNVFCYNEIASGSQYFPEIIRSNLSDHEVFLDVGAFNGDTALEFIKATNNKFSKIIGFEPKQENIEIANSTIKDKRVRFYPYGIGDKNEVLFLAGAKGVDDFAHISREKEQDSSQIQIVRIDDFIKEEYTYLKMDIEGMELSALSGASFSIRQYHPKLAVSVYHKIDDLITIPQTILSIDSKYKLFLRHYWGYCGTDTVLFAI